MKTLTAIAILALTTTAHATTIPKCPAPLQDRWASSSFDQRATMISHDLPAKPCWMNFGTGAYVCTKGEGCSRGNVN
jgi:hypothetical protein